MEKNNMIDTITTVGAGSVGIGGVELMHNLPSVGDTGEIIKYVCQAIIVLITFLGIRKKTRKKNVE